ncbi:hypothetical protein I302_104302 [Kwoniella bestiolae CBS 10118]|uniref:Uncharacterized protein n=1 Tax=Kwoniella bestiolae CBS 10118 TaxID=1296100 RepID=A0A1B9GAY4_9TREE|nr:hypothetical protein I302_03009 [Kwoniella bestiolae CBS 10118]OCF28158.1 hypothetical protein I302_03009 [Kwoniella bestiolae CBS 10118]
MTPGWDEQIVPILKKRLESESQYLTKRLSEASFEEDQPPTASSPRLNSFPQSPTFGVFQHQPQPGSSSIPRTRTKSGPFLNDTRQLSSSSGKRPSPPRINTSASTSSPRTPSAALPSRIPTRPRSKSQLSAASSIRPSPVHSNSQPPPLPNSERSTSGIPILKSRSRSPSKMSVAVETRRESLDLGGTRIKEGFIKNELPPFKMNANEAMRIAEKGHELGDEGRTSCDSSRSGMAERKRSISMKPSQSQYQKNLHPRANGNGYTMERSGSSGSGSDRSARRNSRPSTSSAGYGISTSHTGLGLGMGQPSASRSMNGQRGQRAGSSQSRSPVNGSPSPSAGFNAPRSASLNLLSGSPSMSANGTPPSARLGVAAHFIPPESSYTPPKGTDWDDVVLPTVAKKLGVGVGPGERDGEMVGGGEEDLAVEWDRDGTPIRWVKRKGGGKIGLGLGEGGSGNSNQPNDITPTRPHAFSPTFEPSPDNPLHPRQRPSSTSLRNKPASSDGMELTPLRTTNSEAASLSAGDRSASPSKNTAYYPGGEPFPRSSSGGIHRKSSSQNISTSSPINGFAPHPSLSRKPSTLKKQNHSTPTVSRQGSELSLRTRNASNAGRANNFGPGPGQNGHGIGTPGTTHRITDAIYENQLARREGRVNEKGTNVKKDEGTHGKGCGCLIM